MIQAMSFVAPLFVPANRPDRFAKAAASGADAIILDLEDAVAADEKESARLALRTDFTDKPVLVRINGADTPWHEGDVAAVAALPVTALMMPKCESVANLARLSALRPVVALIETARGMAAARTIAASGAAVRLAFGSVDFAADLGCDHAREALAAARSEIIMASRLADLLAPLDGVTTDLADMDAAADDARHARALGFGGKLVIHPRQVAAVFTGFRPSRSEMEWARRVIASGDGVTSVDGAMIDEPVRIRARAVLARAGL